ncbi:MAG: hypothetical protein AAFX86_01835 [Pseudomonadota bacterium]
MKYIVLGISVSILGGCQTATSYYKEVPESYFGIGNGKTNGSGASRRTDIQYFLAQPQIVLSISGRSEDAPLGRLEAEVIHTADRDAPFLFTRGRNIFDNEYTIEVDERGLLSQVVAGGEGAVGALTQALVQTSASAIVNRRIADAIEAGDAVDTDALPEAPTQSDDSDAADSPGLSNQENSESSGGRDNEAHSVTIRPDFSSKAPSSRDFSTVCDFDSIESCKLKSVIEFYYWGERGNPENLSNPQCPMDFVQNIDGLRQPLEKSNSTTRILKELHRRAIEAEALAEDQRALRTQLTNDGKLTDELLAEINSETAKQLEAKRVAESAIRTPAAFRLSRMHDARCAIGVSARVSLKSSENAQSSEDSDQSAQSAGADDKSGSVNGEANLEFNPPKLPFQNDLVYYRPLVPSVFYLEQCIHMPGEDSCDAWTTIHSFSAPVADNSKLRSVPFLAASAGTNALAVRFVDGSPIYSASVENPASSDLLSAPLQIVDAVLSVPRALLVGAADQVDGD